MKKNTVLVLLRVIIGLAICGYGISQIMTALDNTHSEKVERAEQEQMAVDNLKSNYEELEIGMTYEECVSVLGGEGELFSKSETEYFGKSAVYLWKPEDTLFTGIEAHFDNGKLSAKTWIE